VEEMIYQTQHFLIRLNGIAKERFIDSDSEIKYFDEMGDP
jgi:hypothetical protein